MFGVNVDFGRRHIFHGFEDDMLSIRTDFAGTVLSDFPFQLLSSPQLRICIMDFLDVLSRLCFKVP